MHDVNISIFGGTFTWSAAKQRYLVFKEKFAVPLKSFNTVSLGLKVKGWRSFDEYYYGWYSELEHFSDALEHVIDSLSTAFGMPSYDKAALNEIREAAVRKIDNDGREYQEAIREIRDSYGDANVAAARVCKGGMFVTLEISAAAEMVEGLAFDWLNKHGYKLCKVDLVANAEAAKKMFAKLKADEIREDKLDETKLMALQLDPFNQSFLEWCWERAEDKTPINLVARAMGVSLESVQKAAFLNAVGPKTVGSEEQAKAYLSKVKEAAARFGYDARQEQDMAEKAVRRYDEQARSAGGRLFPTREEAKIQRKLVAFAQKADLSSEEGAKKALVDIADYAKELGIDGTWQLEPVKKLLQKIDEEARSAGGRLFETREEAAKQRELVALEATIDLSSENLALEAREKIEKLIAKLGIDGAWKLERVENALKKFDEAARTAYGKVYKTRQAAKTAKGSPKAFVAVISKVIEDVGEAAFYHGDAIPPKKIQGARSYLTGEQDKGLFALLDTTLFGSAKCGLSMTEWGLVWCNDNENLSVRTSYAWHEFGELKEAFKRDGSIIWFADDAAYDNSGSNVETEKVLAVLKTVCGFAAETTFAATEGSPARKTKKRVSAGKGEEPQPLVAVADIVEALGKIKNANVFVTGSIPEKKKSNAFVSMKVHEPISSIVALVDATVFGSAKDGLVVTDKAVYFKNFTEDPVRIAFSELKKVMAKEKTLYLNDQEFQPGIFDEKEIAAFEKALKPKKNAIKKR